MDSLIQAYLPQLQAQLGTADISYSALPPSGSSRKNWIIETHAGKSVFTYNVNLRENESFIYFSKLFKRRGIPVPEILWCSEDGLSYLQSYAGLHTFYEILCTQGSKIDTAKKILTELYSFQQKNDLGFDIAYAYDFPEFNSSAVLQDGFYFKNFILDILEVSYLKYGWITDLEQLAQDITPFSKQTLIMRDFQSRNVMLDGNNINFIDYQSAMYGPGLYDAVSFIYQVKAPFLPEERKDLMHFFLSLFSVETSRSLQEQLPLIRLIRALQVMGAYGLRGLYQKKPHFMESLTLGYHQLKDILQEFQVLREKYPHIAASIDDIDPHHFTITTH